MYICGMEKRKAISIKLPPELISRVDRIVAGGPIKTTRTAFMEAAIERLCDQMDPPKPAKRPHRITG
jgi:metal-responsive CopG/Arc/MetJ family transcriptional regulator